MDLIPRNPVAHANKQKIRTRAFCWAISPHAVTFPVAVRLGRRRRRRRCPWIVLLEGHLQDLGHLELLAFGPCRRAQEHASFGVHEQLVVVRAPPQKAVRAVVIHSQDPHGVAPGVFDAPEHPCDEQFIDHGPGVEGAGHGAVHRLQRQRVRRLRPRTAWGVWRGAGWFGPGQVTNEDVGTFRSLELHAPAVGLSRPHPPHRHPEAWLVVRGDRGHLRDQQARRLPRQRRVLPMPQGGADGPPPLGRTPHQPGNVGRLVSATHGASILPARRPQRPLENDPAKRSGR